ncbi:MAG TPA: hypothetical protein VLY23_12555 [Candidatus Acidoferrum sp.]|nr:hypothetical protein [Candidatus Acidoferrum sp.]
MASQRRAARLPKRRIPARAMPQPPAGSTKSHALLILILVPGLVFFMSRKAVDHAQNNPPVFDRWPASAPISAVGPHAQAIVSPARYDLDSPAPNLIYARAMFLAQSYDSRPYWRHSKLEVGAPTNRVTADLAIEHLIPCESMGKAVDRIDSNGKMSYGILQFQDWDEWQRVSGISGDPDNTADAIRMAEWAIENGMINHWTCASILKMI